MCEKYEKKNERVTVKVAPLSLGLWPITDTVVKAIANQISCSKQFNKNTSNNSPLNIFQNHFQFQSYWQKYSRSKQLLTLSMLRLLFSKAQKRRDVWKLSKPCHVGINWKALTEHSQMSTHVPGYESFFRFLHNLVLAKLATSSIYKEP